MYYHKLQQTINYFINAFPQVRNNTCEMMLLLLKFNHLCTLNSKLPAVYINIDCYHKGDVTTTHHSILEIYTGLSTIDPIDTTVDLTVFKVKELPALSNTVDWFKQNTFQTCRKEINDMFCIYSERKQHRVKPIDQVFHSLGSRLGMESTLDKVRFAQRKVFKAIKNNKE